jgi:hypothetical protein
MDGWMTGVSSPIKNQYPYNGTLGQVIKTMHSTCSIPHKMSETIKWQNKAIKMTSSGKEKNLHMCTHVTDVCTETF